MSLNTRQYIGMPPDGVGKKFNAAHSIDIEYNNAVGQFTANQEVEGSVSGLTGIVMAVIEDSPTTGELFVRTSLDTTGADFIPGEDILVAGSPIAQVVSADLLMYTQRAQIVGGNSIFNAQFVDRQGAASVRFAEGSTQFDGFGRMNVANITSIGDYQMHYGFDSTMWHQLLTGGGTYTYLNGHAGGLLATGTASGDVAGLVTHRYHPYQAGTGQLIFVTAYCGDSGKAGVTRRWGYFDDEDGVFFELEDTTVNLVVRSSVTGSVVERKYPQSEWNYDQLDGNGTSQFTLDVTKHNLYWINFAWLGVGAVRFGVYGEDGARLVAHIVDNGNVRQEPYMSQPRLPVKFEIENTTAQGATSELFAGCSSVQIEGTVHKNHRPMGSSSVPVKTITGASIHPFVGLRAAQTFNGVKNRKIILPETCDIHAFLSGTDTPARVKFFIIKNPTGLTGSTWVAPNATSSAEMDATTTDPITDGTPIMAHLVSGAHEVDLKTHFDLSADEVLALGSDGVADEYYIAFQAVDPTDSIDVNIAVNWSEI